MFEFRKIKDYCSVGDGAHASIKRVSNGVPYLSSKNFKSDGLDLTKSEFISESDYEKHFNKKSRAITKPEAGDVVVGIIGTLGTPYCYKKTDMFGLSSSVAILRPNDQLSQKYLYYFMRTKAFQYSVESFKSGSAQGFLSLELIKNLPLVVPSLVIQNKISAILVAYDDLIEANSRRIQLLESMAEEIYKEWFVRLRFPKHESVKVAKGVPEGWETKPLSALAKVNPKRINKNTLDWIEYIDISSVGTKTLSDVSQYSIKDAPGRAKRVLRHGDILWASVRPANKAYALILEPTENLIASTGFAVISAKNNLYPFVFQAVTTNTYVEQIAMMAKGANYPATGFDDFAKSEILTPPESLMKAFCDLVLPMCEEQHILRNQNKNLVETRDKLLPRLISGKLSVENLDINFPPSMEEGLA